MVFIAAMICMHLTWIAENRAPPREDDNMQLFKSLQFHHAIERSGPHSLEEVLCGRSVDFYPPLVYAITAIFYHFWGTAEAVGRASMLVYLVLLTFSVYGIARRLFGEPAGLCAALIASAAPTFDHYAHSYFTDGPLTAVVAFNLYCILCANCFESASGSLLWGLSIGIGLLTKWTFGVWVLVPNLVALIVYLRRHPVCGLGTLLGSLFLIQQLLAWRVHRVDPNAPAPVYQPGCLAVYFLALLALAILVRIVEKIRPRLNLNFAWGMLVAFTLSLPWYIENYLELRDGTTMMGNLMGRDPLSHKILLNLLVIRSMVYGAPLLLALGLVLGLTASSARPATAWILTGGLPAFGFMSVLFVYADRYILPILPWVALLAVAWLPLLKPRLQYVVAIIFVPIALSQMALSLPQFRKPVLAACPIRLQTFLPATPVRPDHRDYHVNDVLDLALQTTHGKPVIWVMNNHDNNLIQSRVYEYFARQRNLRVHIMNYDVDQLDNPNALANIALGTHLLVLWNDDTPLKSWLHIACQDSHWQIRLLKVFPLPLGFRASLYLRQSTPAKKHVLRGSHAT